MRETDEPKTRGTIRTYLWKLEHYCLARSPEQGRAQHYYAQTSGRL